MAANLCSPFIAPAQGTTSRNVGGYTLRKKKQKCRRRSSASPAPARTLQATATATDVVTVEFPSGKKNAVLFGSSNSQSRNLVRLWELYQEFIPALEDCLNSMPKCCQHVDDLAGGTYVPYGLGSIPPGPKGCPRSLKGKQIPYLRRTALFKPVRELFEMYGQLMGVATDAIAELLPNFYEENRELRAGANDCTYPKPEVQKSGQCGESTSMSEEDFNCWFANQCIVRIIGKEVGGQTVSDGQIAMHFDESDYPCIQQLMFLPMGGVNGLGGHVPNTDLLVFEGREGGLSYRVDTTVEDTVVVVLMNSSTQLHAGAGEEVTGLASPPSSSIRLIPYLRGPIMDFILVRKEDEREHDLHPHTELLRSGQHLPLEGESLQDGMLVAAEWGKSTSKKTLHLATLNMKEDNKLTVVWADGQISPDYKREVYHHLCASNECHCSSLSL